MDVDPEELCGRFGTQKFIVSDELHARLLAFHEERGRGLEGLDQLPHLTGETIQYLLDKPTVDAELQDGLKQWFKKVRPCVLPSNHMLVGYVRLSLIFWRPQLPKPESTSTAAEFCSLCELKKLAAELRISGAAVEPTTLHANMKKFFERYVVGAQEDAHECLIRLLNHMGLCSFHEALSGLQGDIGSTDCGIA